MHFDLKSGPLSPGGGIVFASGGLPAAGEIALSSMQATDLGVEVGDTFALARNGASTPITVSGIYADITDGGYTAKLPETAQLDPDLATGFVITATVADRLDPETTAPQIAAEISQQHPGAKAIPVDEYAAETLSHIVQALRVTTLVTIAFGVGIIVLITTLFVQLRLAAERQQHATLHAIGFSRGAIIQQLLVTVLLVAVPGVVTGVVLRATAGEAVVSALFSALGLGLTGFSFIPDLVLTFVFIPASVIVLALGSALAAIFSFRNFERFAS